MEVTIERYNPDNQSRFTSRFSVPVPLQECWSVMDVLDYISLKLDPSLSYYKHSACDHGICGRCSLAVNGKTRLACVEVVSGSDDCLALGPAPGRTPIKDLVTRL